MKIYEIGTGYTSIPAQMGAATEIVVEELTKSLQQLGENVQILDISDVGRAAHNLTITEVRVPSVFSRSDVHLGLIHKLKRVVYSVSLAVSLRRILRKTSEPLILHFHNQYNLFFFHKLVSAHLRKKAHITYTVHSYIWHDDWSRIQNIVSKRYFQECFCVQHADSVFVLNEQTRTNFIRHLQVPEHHIHLVNNGVNTDIYHPLTSEQISAAKEKHGLAGKKVLIQIGSVCDRKNQLGALELLYPLMQKDDQIVYCYAGGIISEEYQESIRHFAAEKNIESQVKYLGELEPGSALNEAYNLAEAMVFPSKAEGFSLVILEAMSAGVPVIIHDHLQFALADRCLKFSNPEAFASMLQSQVLSEKKTPDSATAVRQPILEAYTWSAIAKEYLSIWNNSHL